MKKQQTGAPFKKRPVVFCRPVIDFPARLRYNEANEYDKGVHYETVYE